MAFVASGALAPLSWCCAPPGRAGRPVPGRMARHRARPPGQVGAAGPAPGLLADAPGVGGVEPRRARLMEAWAHHGVAVKAPGRPDCTRRTAPRANWT
jgi:hypothetical protein